MSGLDPAVRPWRAAEVPCGNLIVESGNGKSLAIFQTKSLARDGWAYRAHVANAHLFSAAPDLLEAVRAMKDAAVYQSAALKGRHKALADQKFMDALTLASAAIAKATGETGQ